MSQNTPQIHQSDSENLLEKALEWYENGQSVMIATVIQTWGSSPRQTGSQLIMNQNAEFLGSVSGGCIESAVVTEALDMMSSDVKCKILEFSVAHETAWEVGLACGGTVRVFLQPFNPENCFRDIIQIIKDKKATVSFTNLKTGQIHLYTPNISQECYLDKKINAFDIHQVTEKALKTDKASIIETDEDPEEVSYFVTPYNPPRRLYIVGAVHIAQFLAPMAQQAGYDVTVIDHRQAWGNQARFPNITIDPRWADEVFEEKQLDHRTAIVTLTHDPKLDDPALESALQSNVFYIGALGSVKTHEKRIERLKEVGISEAVLKRINGPIGLDIGAANPFEIALSILAEITRALRGPKRISKR